MEDRICNVCSKIYTPKVHQQRTCSPSCSKIWHKRQCSKRQKERIIKKICAECGAEFETNNRNKLTCSSTCAAKRSANNKKYYQRRAKTEGKKKEKLAEIAKQAKQVGLSYGQYVAQQYIKER